MEIKEIKDKNNWDNFFLNIKDKTFLQSFNWGDFQEKRNNKIWRLGIYKDNLVGLALVVKIKAKRGTFLLISHGPTILEEYREEGFNLLFKELEKIGKKEKVDFIRINPLWENNFKNVNILKKIKFHLSPIPENSYESTIKLNTILSEEEILKNMRKTTRYLIKKTSKDNDIKVEKSDNLDLLDRYQKLSEKVGKRQKFIPFSYDFIKNEFEIFKKDNNALLFFGKYKNEVVCGALIIFWNNIAFYHQAASDNEFSKFSVPYLLQWEAILEAKRRNCDFYDFWGYTDPKKFPNHPWAGPTLFKLGYSNNIYNYIKTWDYPMSLKYYFIYLFERVRRLKRKI